MQVTPFSTGSMYTFGSPCDHWLIAPTTTTTGLVFSVAVNFVEEDLTIGRTTIRYSDLELVSTASGEFESNITPLSRQETNIGMVFTFSHNVVAITGTGFNSVELSDISVTVTHTYAPESSEGIEIAFGDVSKVPAAQGLCGNVDGSLVIGGTSSVADVTDIEQLLQFSRSWLLPASLQTSTIEACSKSQTVCICTYTGLHARYT